METKEQNSPGQEEKITAEAFAAKLKSKHQVGNVYRIRVPDDKGTFKEGWIKKIGRSDYESFSAIAQSQPIKAMEVLMNNVWLEGDRDLIDDDDYFFSAMAQVKELMSVRAGELKKF